MTSRVKPGFTIFERRMRVESSRRSFQSGGVDGSGQVSVFARLLVVSPVPDSNMQSSGPFDCATS